MKIVELKTYLANAGIRNYLFVRLRTDSGLTGVGEASAEWQEKTVETFIHEWVKDRVIGKDPFDIESVVGEMIRDQYHGGSTIMVAISGVEIAMWDIIGKACGQPVYKLLGGQCHYELEAYANGWYGAARTPHDYAQAARIVLDLGYQAMKFDPFGIAWKEMTDKEKTHAVGAVRAVRKMVGPRVKLMIEGHGRLSVNCAVEMGKLLEPYDPVWFEEPVATDDLDLLREVRQRINIPVAAGERLYSFSEFHRLSKLRAADIVQMDVTHCGGLLASKKIASMVSAEDMRIAPHCSVGPVALAASLHVDLSTPNFMIQEAFGEFDVSWRRDMVCGWNPIANGRFIISEKPGLGIELDEAVLAKHPYIRQPFPSLWDSQWLTTFTQGN